MKLSPLLIGATVLTLAACNSGHLSRSNAKSQLDKAAKQYANANGIHPLLLTLGTISVANCVPANYISDYDPIPHEGAYANLAATGYITMRQVRKNLWRVELTQKGTHVVSGEKYGHRQEGDCDEWQVMIPLSKFDHLDVTGIIEDGPHAKVDVAATFVITPVGLAIRNIASEDLLGVDLLNAPPNKDRYVKAGSAVFDKYDDGWKFNDKDK